MLRLKLWEGRRETQPIFPADVSVEEMTAQEFDLQGVVNRCLDKENDKEK